jgi:hypothetical protein
MLKALEGRMDNIPYQLSEGLFLEASGKLLPWFKSLHQITKKGGKPLPEKGKTSQLFWKNDVVFDSLEVSVSAVQQGEGMFFLNIQHGKEFESVQSEYEFILGVLTKKFGGSTETGNNDGYPFSRWLWGDIRLNLTIAERFMEYIALSISKGVIK